MSLWRQRNTIKQAVAGQLSAADEAKLRQHLAGCFECRNLYDALTVQARILAGKGAPTATESERELARLMAAIAPAAPKKEPNRWPLLTGALATCGAIALAVLVLAQPGAPTEEISFRGDTADGDYPFVVKFVTAPMDGGSLRADLVPFESNGRITSKDWVAFSVDRFPGRHGFFRAVLVNEKGEAMVLQSGQSVSLDPGTWTMFAVAIGTGTADRALDGFSDDVLLGAAEKLGVTGRTLQLPPIDHPVSQVVRAFVVEP